MASWWQRAAEELRDSASKDRALVDSNTVRFRLLKPRELEKGLLHVALQLELEIDAGDRLGGQHGNLALRC